MNINILRYSLFGIAAGQEVDRTFVKLQNVLIVLGGNINKYFG